MACASYSPTPLLRSLVHRPRGVILVSINITPSRTVWRGVRTPTRLGLQPTSIHLPRDGEARVDGPKVIQTIAELELM